MLLAFPDVEDAGDDLGPPPVPPDAAAIVDPSSVLPFPPPIPDAGIIADTVMTYYFDGGITVPEPKWLKITGNRILPEEIYRNTLKLPEGAVPDAATAAYIEQTLTAFLLNGGYDLATVSAVANDGVVNVHIDEGQLEKIVFTGRLTFNTLRFRIELFLDQGVFNRPAVERQVAVLSEKIGLSVVRWSLVPTAHPDHLGPQLETLGIIDAYDILHARKRYELWFFFQESDWNTGPGLDLRSGYIDGLELGLNYQGLGRFDDRFRIAASAGAGLRFRESDHLLYPAFSRALLEARWYSKKLGPTRIGLSFTSNLYDRQRKDLDVEDYKDARAAAAVDLGIRLTDGATLTPALGFEWQKVFDVTPTDKNPDFSKVPPGSERIMSFADLQFDWAIGEKNARWDRQHRLELGGRYYFGRSLDTLVQNPTNAFTSYGYVYERYQQVFEFGWHDLWVKSRTRLAFGDVRFQDEENLGELLRGVFGTFERKAGNLEFEFRFSLSRDVLKVSFFSQIAAWGEVFDRSRDVEAFRFGVAAGPGFHALILGMFQMDLYASVGYRARSEVFHDSPLAIGFVALLNKTY